MAAALLQLFLVDKVIKLSDGKFGSGRML